MIRTGLIWSALCLAAMAGIVLWTASQLPYGVEIPTHWGPSGEADAWSSREDAIKMLWLLPGISAFTAIALAIAPLLDPRKTNLMKSRQAYLAGWIGAMVLLTLVTGGVCLTILRGAELGDAFNANHIVRWIVAGSALLFVVIGNYLPKTRPSWIIGVRTPWTLSSDYTWEKTHRLAGRLFMLAGILAIIGAFTLDGIWLALQLTALVLSAAIFSVIYSYFVWRTADDRQEGNEYTV